MYRILSPFHTNNKGELCYDEADAQVDMDVVTHAPQRPVRHKMIS